MLFQLEKNNTPLQKKNKLSANNTVEIKAAKLPHSGKMCKTFIFQDDQATGSSIRMPKGLLKKERKRRKEITKFKGKNPWAEHRKSPEMLQQPL